MTTLNVICVMGIWCDPASDCHGLRPFLEGLKAKYQIVTQYVSYQMGERELEAGIEVAESLDAKQTLLIGHSKGGELAYVTAAGISAFPPDQLASLLMIEPVDVMPNLLDMGFEDYDPIQNIGKQHCIYSSLPFHLGHKYRDDSLNTAVAFGHNDCCNCSVTLNYIEDEIVRLTQ